MKFKKPELLDRVIIVEDSRQKETYREPTFSHFLNNFLCVLLILVLFKRGHVTRVRGLWSILASFLKNNAPLFTED